MTAFRNKKLPGEPIIVNVFTSQLRVGEHLGKSVKEIIALLEEAGEPCYLITDVREVAKMSLDDVIAGSNFVTRESGALLQHRLIKAFLLVTTSKLYEMVGKGLRHDIFGNVNVHIFASVEEALTYARSQAN